jgi:outer membrane protein OmpA-like peptidoglycan-associated protein
MRSLVPLLVAVLVSTGCATKKYVVGQVGEVNNKVAALSTEIEKTQQRSQRNEARIDEVNQSAQAAKAFSRAEEAERLAKGKLVYQVTLSNDKVTFPRNRAKLSDDAKKLVDETVGPVVADNRGAYLEIEGHTDSTGSASYNRRLGEDRALAVRDYLHDHYQIALNRMAVISYGGAKPVEDNKTRANRAMNRRVVISVLE